MTLKLAWANVRRSYKDFAIYFLTLMVGVAVFYAFNSVGEQRAVLDMDEAGGNMIELLGMLIDYVSVFIVVILMFLVVYASRFLIRRRNKEFGLYLLLGMPRMKLLSLTAAETLLVGIFSLVAGLALGFVLSQLLVWVTAMMFVADLSQGFSFFFSVGIAVRTVGIFLVIFVLSLLFNIGHSMRAKLIDLINADKKNEVLVLRSIPVAFVLFIISVVLIAVSYKTLLDNGLMATDGSFQLATALVCVGTVLFFYSLSGFLLRVIQSIKGVYYRGLNMFVLRQIASRINSSFISMSIICMTLFFAITSVCGGIGICNALQGSYAGQTSYDATVRTYYNIGEGTDSSFAQALEMYGTDMDAGIEGSARTVGAAPWDSMVRESGQVDYYLSDVTYGDMNELSGKPLSDYNSAVESGYEDQPVSLIKLSQFNNALAMAGKEPVSLDSGELLILCDFDALQGYFDDIAAKGGSVDLFGREFTLADRVDSTCIETTSTAMNTGAFVINDDEFPEEANDLLYASLLNVMFVDEGALEQFTETLDAISESSDPSTWPVSLYQTRQGIYDQNVGLTTIISYLAIYIGFVLVVACAAILAIQQLTAAADNRRRYRLLDKLGASKRMVDGALLKQIAIAFAFPMVLAVCHSICALMVVIDIVNVFGHVEIGEVAAIAAGAFLAVYLIYFVLTYFQARSVIHSER